MSLTFQFNTFMLFFNNQYIKVKLIIRLILIITFQVITVQNTYSQKIIKLEKVNGIYKIPCKVNGILMNFIFDTGATDVSISLTEANFLMKQGLLRDEDIKEVVKYKLANGKVEKGTKIILKQIDIDGLILENIEASIVHNLDAPLLLGLNAISKLGRVVIEENKLIIYPKNIVSQENTENHNIDSVFYSNVQQAYIELLQSLKTNDSKIFINKFRHLFANPVSYVDITTSQFKNESEINEAIDDNIKLHYKRLFLFGLKHKINYANIDTKNIKFSIKKSDIIITFKYDSDFYVIESWFYSSGSDNKYVIEFPERFESINAYEYNKTIKGFFDDYDHKKITEKEYRNKQVEFSEWQYKYLSKNDIQYLHEFNKLEDAYILRALCRFKYEGDYLGAIQDWNRVIELSKGEKLVDAYYGRGRCKLALEDYRSAILDFNKCISLDSKINYIPSAYLLRGNAKQSLKDYKSAFDDYNKAIKLDPKDSDAYYGRGFVKYYYLKNKVAACADWSKAGELGIEEAYELIKENCN